MGVEDQKVGLELGDSSCNLVCIVGKGLPGVTTGVEGREVKLLLGGNMGSKIKCSLEDDDDAVNGLINIKLDSAVQVAWQDETPLSNGVEDKPEVEGSCSIKPEREKKISKAPYMYIPYAAHVAYINVI